MEKSMIGDDNDNATTFKHTFFGTTSIIIKQKQKRPNHPNHAPFLYQYFFSVIPIIFFLQLGSHMISQQLYTFCITTFTQNMIIKWITTTSFRF